MRRYRYPLLLFIVVASLVALTTAAVGFDLGHAPQVEAPELPRAVAEAQAIAAPGPQADILADGVVSWDEHEAAIARTAACLSDAGVTVELHPAHGKKATSIGFAAPTLPEAEAARAKLEACKAVHLGPIETVWMEQLRPTPEKEREMPRWVAQCVRERAGGVDPATSSWATLLDLQREGAPAQSTAVTLCIDQRAEVFGQ